jgi:CubicO group peptidase (beta-lactamase class C family)
MLTILSAAVLFFTAGFSSFAPSVLPAGEDYAKMESYFRGEMGAGSISGAEFVIVKNGAILHQGSFGTTDSNDSAMTPQTVTNIGGISKSFTTLAAYQLLQAGKIELDAPVTTYLPWFTVQDKASLPAITIRTLLDHTSGLSKSSGQQPELFTEGINLDQFVKNLSWARLVTKPGITHEESNLNYLILGEIIQVVSEQSYADYVKQNILVPLGMKHTWMTAAEARQNGLITGNKFVFGFKVSSTEPLPDGLAPIGYVYSTLEDMAVYMAALTNHGSANGVTVLPLDKDIDLYWNSLKEHPVESTQLQAGESRTYDSAMLFDPHQQLAILVLSNTSTNLVLPVKSASSMARDLYSLIHGQTPGSAAPLKTWYIGMDICAGLAIIGGLFHGLGLITWRKRYTDYQGNHFWAFLPTVLLDFVLPFVVIFGLPFAIMEKTSISVTYASSLWSRLFFSIPDIAYIAYVICAAFLIMGFVKAVWIMKNQS